MLLPEALQSGNLGLLLQRNTATTAAQPTLYCAAAVSSPSLGPYLAKSQLPVSFPSGNWPHPYSKGFNRQPTKAMQAATVLCPSAILLFLIYGGIHFAFGSGYVFLAFWKCMGDAVACFLLQLPCYFVQYIKKNKANILSKHSRSSVCRRWHRCSARALWVVALGLSSCVWV